MSNLCIFTGGDDLYFDLIHELIQSINILDNSIPVVVIDGGIHINNLTKINYKNVFVVRPEFCNGESKSIVNILRLRLDQICKYYSLPYKTLIWLDADTWVQNLYPFLDICKTVCNKKKLIIKSQSSRLDRKTIQTQKVVNFGTFSLFRLKNIIYKNSKFLGFSNETLEKLESVATLNSGVFALDIDAPHWERFRYWQEYIIKENNGKKFNSDQLSIGYTIYLDILDYELFPDICNYFCGHPLRWNENTKKFVDFYPPYDEINIIHHCGITKFIDNWDKIKVLDMNDNSITKSVLFSNRFET